VTVKRMSGSTDFRCGLLAAARRGKPRVIDNVAV
jgi:hypothetical protein